MFPQFEAAPKHEIVIDPQTGKVRQAGTIDPAANAITEFKRVAEKKLYIFAKYVMNMSLLTEGFHAPECAWLQKVPPRRKLWMTPRNHLKSSVMRSKIAHLLIQPVEDNVYFPGCTDKICRYRREGTAETCDLADHRMDGRNTRILLGRETAGHAEAGVRWLEGQWESNELLRALWPHCVWPKGATPKRGWNQQEMTLPRTRQRVEPSVYGLGVGGAATGWHFDVHSFDDLVTDKAADSPQVMETAWQWFRDSRALLDSQEYSLEWTTGTHWAVMDVYHRIMFDADGAGHGDPTVEARVRSIVEDGKIVFPEMGYNWENILQLQASDPVRFALMYMNSLADPSIADFNISEVREYAWQGSKLVFNTDERDALLEVAFGRSILPVDPAREGPIPLNAFIESLGEGNREAWMMAQRTGVKGA